MTKFRHTYGLIAGVLFLLGSSQPASSENCKCDDISKLKARCSVACTQDQVEAARKKGTPFSEDLFPKEDINRNLGAVSLGANKEPTEPGSSPTNNGGNGNSQSSATPFGDPLGQGGGGGGGDGGGGDGGGGDQGCKDDTPVEDPNTGQCHLRGELVPANRGAAANTCGQSVELSSEWMTTVNNPNAALIVKAGSTTLDGYTRTGSSLAFSASSNIPMYYCILIDGVPDPNNPGTWLTPPTAQKQLLETLGQFIALNNNSQFAPISMKFPGGGQASEDFIVMKRQGNSLRFTPPAPNPGFFTALGAVDVDPNCYTLDQLFDPLPAGFGDMRLSNIETGMCFPQYEQPQPKGCETSKQYLNMDVMQLYMPPGTDVFTGKVSGGASANLGLVQSKPGNFVADAAGEIVYDGAVTRIVDGNKIYIGFGLTNGVQQSFIGGGALLHDSGNIVRLNRPGRFKVYANGQIQLIDGGTVETANGQLLRQIAGNGSIQFNKNQPIEVVSGSSLVLDTTNILPTRQLANNGPIKARAAYDPTKPCPKNQ